MSCWNNFTQTLPHPIERMSWLAYSIQFLQPLNIFGNFTTSVYFMDKDNRSSLPLNIRFQIMESPCHNEGTCYGKSSTFNKTLYQSCFILLINKCFIINHVYTCVFASQISDFWLIIADVSWVSYRIAPNTEGKFSCEMSRNLKILKL